MVKKYREEYSERKIILDTTYVLPILGIEVEGLDRDILDHLIKYELYYPALLLVELESVVLKEARKRGLKSIPEQAIKGLNFLIYSGEINIVAPTGEDLKVMYELLRRGWKDIFDLSLYATAIRIDSRVLTMDKSFKKFLKDHGFHYQLLITHKGLKT